MNSNRINLTERKNCVKKIFDDDICTCRQYNRNTNAYNNENDEQQQQQQQPPPLYSHMRKLYNDDTDLLEYVYIIMSTVKPNDSDTKQQDDSLGQQHSRISKQRAKVRITNCCREK